MVVIYLAVPTFVSVLLILYFRRKDKRNTQLQTLKNFINASIAHMEKIFSDKEKELMDKTINLDIALKKLDKASNFINNKLAEIKDSMTQIEGARQAITVDLKTAASFDKEVQALQTKLAETSHFAGEIDSLRKEIQDNRKTASQIKTDIEQTRVWAEDNVTGFMKKAQDEVTSAQEDILARTEKIAEDFQKKSEDLGYTLVKAEDGLSNLEQRLNGFQDHFEEKLDDAERAVDEQITKSFEETKERISNSVQEVNENLTENEKVLQESLLHKLSDMNQQMTEVGEDFDNRKSNLMNQIADMTQGIENQFKTLENVYKVKTGEMEEKFLSVSSNMTALEKRIHAEAESLTSRANTELTKEIELLKQNIEKNAHERLKQIDERITGDMKKFESSFGDHIKDMNNKLNANSNAVNDMNGKIAKFVKEVTDKFKVDVAAMKSSTVNETQKFIEDISIREKSLKEAMQSLNADLSRSQNEIRNTGKETVEQVLLRLSEREKQIFAGIDKSSGIVSDRFSQIEKTVSSYEAELNKKLQAIGAEMEKELEDYRKSIENLQENGLKIESTIQGIISTRTKEIDSYLQNLKESYVDDYKQLIDNTKNELIDLKEEIESSRDAVNSHKSDVKNEIEASMQEARKLTLAQTADIKSEIESVRLRSDGMMVDVQDEIEKKMDGFQKDLLKRFEEIRQDAEKEMESYREYIDGLNKDGARIEIDVKETAARYQALIDSSHQDLKNEFLKVYEQLTDKTKNDLLVFQEELNSIREFADGQKTGVMKEIEESLKEIRNWSSAQAEDIKAEIANTRSYSSGVMEEVQEEIDKKIEIFHRDFDARAEQFKKALLPPVEKVIENLTDRCEAIRVDLEKKTDNARKIMEESLGQFKEAEQHLLSRTTELDSELDTYEEKTLLSIKAKGDLLEGEFTKKMEETSNSLNLYLRKSDTDLKTTTETVRKELASLEKDLRSDKNRIKEEALNDIKELNKRTKEIDSYLQNLKESYDGEYQQLIDTTKNELIDLKDEILNSRKDIDSHKTDIFNEVEGNLKEINNKYQTLIETSHQNLKNDFIKEYEQLTGRTKNDLQVFQEELNSIREFAEGQKTGVMKEIEDSLKEIRNWSLTQAEGIKAEVDKTRSYSSEVIEETQEEIEKKMNDFQKDLLKRSEEIRMGIEKEMDKYRENIDGLRKDGSRIETGMQDTAARYQALIESSHQSLKNDFIKEYEQLTAKTKNDLAEFQEELNSIRKFADGQKTGVMKEIEAGLDEIRSWSLAQAEGIKSEIESTRINTNGVIEEVQEEIGQKIEAFRKDFDVRAEQFKKALLPPVEKVIENLSSRCEAIRADLEKKTENTQKSLEDSISRFKLSEQQLLLRTKELDQELDTFEEKTLTSIKTMGNQLEGEFAKKMGETANSLNEYLRKSDSELRIEAESVRKELSSLAQDLRADKTRIKEEVVDDIKELNKRTKEIETRYDNFMKKSTMLERAETLAEKSNRNVETISQYLKDLEEKRKEIETAVKTIDSIRTESRELNGVLTLVGSTRKDAVIMQQTVNDALSKAKEVQDLLSTIEKQQSKAEGIKDVMVETLKVYEEVRTKIADVEGKRDVINRIMASIDHANDSVQDAQSKISAADDKITSINKITKKIEDDIRAAQTNINKLFGDQERANYAVDKISDIENLLIHIEEESKKVQKMRDWVAKLETQLERIKDTQDTAVSGSGKKPAKEVDRGTDEDMIKNILRLREQSWSVEDISKSLKISRAYVELIIERYEE